MRNSLSFVFVLLALGVYAQNKNVTNLADITGGVGKNQGSVSVDYFHIWRLGKSRKLELGFGGRFTSYFGSDRYYTSAPASLASDESKSDSLLVSSAQANALNLAINLGYRISNKLGLGFNIDAVGFSFGGNKNATYINGSQDQASDAKPTSFNTLLVDNNDHGTLNSEFYGRYFITKKWAIKLAYQYLFTEYTTDSKVQQVPEVNDRFRHKSGLLSVGITKQF